MSSSTWYATAVTQLKADEPSATQPLMYQKIKKHPTPRKIYADKLEQEKVATLEDATEMVNLYRDALDAGDCVVAGGVR